MEVIRMALRFSFKAAAVLVAVGLAQAADQVAPKELVQFVRQAKVQGLADTKIKQQAMAVGWPATMVDSAIASEKDGKNAPAPNASASAKFEAPAAPLAEMSPV